MKTSLTLFGINHRTTPLPMREKCSLSHDEICAELKRLSTLPIINGCVILFTCNRTEYYVACSENVEATPAAFFPSTHMFSNDHDNHVYTKKNTDALWHLFRVAAGLDSQVLGENEVLFQVKEAYRISQEMHCLGKDLHKIFEQSFRVGRKVRRETAISKGNVSIASLVIKALEKKCGLAGKTVMLIGINKIISQIAKYLLEHAIHTALVGNRTFEKAVELARMLGGEAVHLDHLNQLIQDIDIIITATSAPHFIIKKEKVLEALNKRTKPVYIIDLAVPRDVDPELRQHQQVYLYNLEEIQPLVETNMISRQQEAQKAEHLVRESAQGFAAQLF